jgi:hypothetical protein
MVLQIHSEPEKEMNWSTVSEFVDKKRMSRISPPCTYFIQECKSYGVNWVLCFLWAGIRTQFWSAKCWTQNNDCCNLGGNYQSIRESVRDCCKEFDKFIETDMLIEQQQIEKDYAECAAFARGENPSGSDPIVTPPKTIPLPPSGKKDWWVCNCPDNQPPLLESCTRCGMLNPLLPPKPENEPLPKPSTPVKWGKWISIATPILVFLTGFLPPPFNFIIKLLIQALSSIFNLN